jgi:PAS domain S-box-containing protein
VYKNEAGEVQGVFAAARDITDRKRAEEKALQLLQNLEMVMDSMDALVYVADMETFEMLFLNQYGRDFFPDFAPGKKCYEVLQAGQTGPCPFCTNDRLVDAAGNPTEVYRWEFQNTKTGIWFECRNKAIQWHNRRLVRLEIATDITELKKAEALLHIKDIAVASAIAGIAIADLDGRISYVNAAWLHMHGYDSDAEVRGTTPLKHVRNPADVEAVVKAIKQEGFWTGEVACRRRDGSYFTAQLATNLMTDSTGQPMGMLASFQDITERKRAEDELRRLNEELEQRVMDRTAQLEAANKELEAFSYSVSHDLRSPLRAIDGFSHILMKEHTDRLDAEGVRLLNVIRTNTKHMDQLITDMLSLSRVSKSEMKRSRIDMTTLAHSVYHEVVPPEVRQKLSFSVAPLLDSDGDPVLLRHVWSNLLSNAVKFTLPREERRIEISGHKEQGMNIYAVRDTGVGFNPNYAHKLFGVFQRLHKSSEFEGNGVGLAIVRRIVERHGGRVWAEGKINEGAAFFFSLPIKEVKDEPHE